MMEGFGKEECKIVTKYIRKPSRG